MAVEIVLKGAVIVGILIAALVHPILSAIILTAVAALRIQNYTILESALMQKLVDLTPPGIKSILVGSGPIA